MIPLPDNLGQVLSTILRHDAKVTSYKIALLRAVNDVVLAFPDMGSFQLPSAIPLRLLAERWVAYYWPFVAPGQPVLQGPRSMRQGQQRNDMAFRPALTLLRQRWEELYGSSSAADGFFLVNDMRLPRRQARYPAPLRAAYDQALAAIVATLQMPIRYAGPAGEQWTIFERPAPYRQLQDRVVPLPGARLGDLCLVLPVDLWRTFQAVSLWVEALCLHEWTMFTAGVPQEDGQPADRGAIYRLLTDRPDNRRPLDWERNAIDVLLLEGRRFVCPWTERPIVQGRRYDVDHLLPITIYPVNELWNLVPADPDFNQHVKRERLPSETALRRAAPHLAETYALYHGSTLLREPFTHDVLLRFARVHSDAADFPQSVAQAVSGFLSQVATQRNVARF